MTLFGNDPATTGVLVTARTGRAFVLVLAAAGATALGSCSVFYPSLAQWATADVLAASLGFASGVMLYVSLVDIYTKSMTGFQDQGYTADQAFCYTTFSFFAGILLMKAIDVLIHKCTSETEFQLELGMEEMVARNQELALLRNSPNADSSEDKEEEEEEGNPFSSKKLVESPPLSSATANETLTSDETTTMATGSSVSSSSVIAPPHHPATFLWQTQHQPSSLSSSQESSEHDCLRSSHSTHLVGNSSNSSHHHHNQQEQSTLLLVDRTKDPTGSLPPVSDLLELVETGFSSAATTTRTEPTCVVTVGSGSHDPSHNGNDDDDKLLLPPHAAPAKQEQAQLFHMGLVTAAAIALHNFPEGLVTFVAYVEDPAVGVALAIGIAIHNIPEGLCVAMPIYYATGSRWTAFWWGCFSGWSEPLGALTGWLILQSSFSGQAYGILFGGVAGMMVYICLDELLPMAFRFHPQGTLVTWTCVAGMFLVALSLILFSI